MYSARKGFSQYSNVRTTAKDKCCLNRTGKQDRGRFQCRLVKDFIQRTGQRTGDGSPSTINPIT